MPEAILHGMPALLAAGAAGGGFAWAQWIARILNFVIFAGVLLYFAWPTLVRLLKDRQKGIGKELAQAEQALTDARTRKAEAEQTLARLEKEAAGILETARDEAGEERERILARARTDAERLLQLAEQQIESAGREARQDLRRYAARLSTELAEEILREEIGAKEMGDLFDEGVRGLEKEA